ncbi:MAG TPA: hypothetical protein VMF64_11420 [Steroidobacteraceae bacterium]|nr:hypothetical protein [Steroidobacteraceae bacterium]
MKRAWLLLMMMAGVAGVALVGCSHGKAPTARSTASAKAAPAPAVATATAGAGASAPATGPAATPAAGGAGAGPAAPSGTDNGVPARADLVLLAGAAFDGCKAPAPPPDPPDGHVATREQMLSSHKLTSDFNAATDTYLACLDHAADNFNRQYGRIMPLSGVRQVIDLHDRIHNQAVDADQAVANKFNVQLRIYKARASAP